MTESMPAIMFETGHDESFLVGTKEEIRSFANQILAAVEGASGQADYLGVPCQETVGPMSSTWGDVAVCGLVITQTPTDTKRLINAIRRNNGELPICAEGWPV